MALVDDSYTFLLVDTVGYGSNADSTIFQQTEFGKAWINNPTQLNIPNSLLLPDTTTSILLC